MIDNPGHVTRIRIRRAAQVAAAHAATLFPVQTWLRIARHAGADAAAWPFIVKRIP